MTQQEFLTHIADAIQRDEPLTPDMPLDSIEEYDSLPLSHSSPYLKISLLCK